MAAFGLALSAAPGKAGPPPLSRCGLVTDPVQASAIQAAEDWRGLRWAQVNAVVGARSAAKPGRTAKVTQHWSTAYLIPPPPPAPLGIGTFARAKDLGAGLDVPTHAITGIADVEQQVCVVSAPAVDGSVPIQPAVQPAVQPTVQFIAQFVVQFWGQGLRFNEGGQGWSRPLRRPALLHALIVARPAPDAPWTIVEDAEARTALIPGSKLSQPSAADMTSTLVASVRRRR